MRSENIKLIEENKGDELLDVGLGDDLLNLKPKATKLKKKKKKVGLHHTIKASHSKEIYQ